MKHLTITDVRVLPGDSGFLLDDGKTAILYDSGFAFTGDGLASNIQKALGSRSLDYIFLTHSHYDHVLGTPYVLRRYPDTQVVAGAYAKEVFERSSAKAHMRELDRQHAAKHGVTDYEDLIDDLRVDIAVRGGDRICCGDMTFTVVDLPGHTQCSIGFYLAENKLLLGTETLGVYFGDNTYLPSYLVGYQMTLDSFRRAKSLNIENILLPHYGLIGQEDAKRYLTNSERVSVATAQRIRQLLQNGSTKADIAAEFKRTAYKDIVCPIYPIDAFHLNTRLMIDLIQKELMENQWRP